MIAPGTILIDRTAAHPACFHLRDEACPNAWMRVSLDFNAHELEKELSTTGWTFFYMAGSIDISAFGFDPVKRLNAALRRLIRSVRLQKCNCLEIDSIATRSFLGIPYISISVHPRHVQKGLVFCGQ